MRGPEGPVGATGPKGSTWNPASRAFLILVAVATAVSCVTAYVAFEAHDLSKQNRVAIHRLDDQGAKLEQLRQAQHDSCQNYEKLKGAVNDFHKVVKDALVAQRRTDADRARTIRNPTLKAVDRRSVVILSRILRHIRTVSASCAQKDGVR